MRNRIDQAGWEGKGREPLQAGDIPLPGADRELRHVRLFLRIQLDAGDVRVEPGSGNPKQGTWAEHDVQIKDVVAVLHTERTLKLKRDVFAGERHGGGIAFDVLE